MNQRRGFRNLAKQRVWRKSVFFFIMESGAAVKEFGELPKP
jgi:hypothetical protein